MENLVHKSFPVRTLILLNMSVLLSYIDYISFSSNGCHDWSKLSELPPAAEQQFSPAASWSNQEIIQSMFTAVRQLFRDTNTVTLSFARCQRGHRKKLENDLKLIRSTCPTVRGALTHSSATSHAHEHCLPPSTVARWQSTHTHTHTPPLSGHRCPLCPHRCSTAKNVTVVWFVRQWTLSVGNRSDLRGPTVAGILPLCILLSLHLTVASTDLLSPKDNY